MTDTTEADLRALFAAVGATTVVPAPLPIADLLRRAPAPPAPTARSRRHRVWAGASRRRWWGVRIVSGVVAAAAVTAAVVFTHNGAALSPSQAAVIQLHAAARAAAREPAPVARAGQWVFTTTESTGLSYAAVGPGAAAPVAASVTSRDQQWVPVNATGTYQLLRKSTTTAVHYLHPGDRARLHGRFAWPLRDGPLQWEELQGTTGYVGFGAPTVAFLAQLPTDPAALRPIIVAAIKGQGPDPDWELLDTVASVLRSGIAPPKLRAALYDIAASIPGVQLISDAPTYNGRHGIAVMLSRPLARLEVIFDPVTSDLLGTREIATIATAYHPAGIVLDDESVTVTIVDHLPTNAPPRPVTR